MPALRLPSRQEARQQAYLGAPTTGPCPPGLSTQQDPLGSGGGSRGRCRSRTASAKALRLPSKPLPGPVGPPVGGRQRPRPTRRPSGPGQTSDDEVPRHPVASMAAAMGIPASAGAARWVALEPGAGSQDSELRNFGIGALNPNHVAPPM